MSIIQKYLQTGNLDDLCDKYHIKRYFHDQFPLVILNYDQRYSPKNNEIVAICRGLILEVDTWTPVCQGLTRFFDLRPSGGPHESQLIPQSAEIKEDGTLINLFNYNGQWLLSTKNNFADDYLSNSKDLTYSQLFEKISGQTISQIGQKLNPKLTYCLEMCSTQNRIIRNYSVPEIYLLTCFENGTELTSDQIDQQSTAVGWKRPFKYQVENLDQCNQLLESFCLKDPLFEGFVVKDIHGNRYKFKNPFYLLIHKLKYRGWKVALPPIVVPLIQHHTDRLPLIYEALIHDRSNNDFLEYEKRFNFYRSALHNQSILLDNKDPFINYQHPHKYCYGHLNNTSLNTGLAQDHPYFDGLKWNVKCYCGSQMYLHRIKADHLIYKKCPICNISFDILVYQVGTLIWLCSQCPLIHDSYSRQSHLKNEIGKPNGIPCSEQCYNLTLTIHQMLNEIRCKKNCQRHETYQLLSDLMQFNDKPVNIALFDIEMCLTAIRLLQDHI